MLLLPFEWCKVPLVGNINVIFAEPKTIKDGHSVYAADVFTKERLVSPHKKPSYPKELAMIIERGSSDLQTTADGFRHDRSTRIMGSGQNTATA